MNSEHPIKSNELRLNTNCVRYNIPSEVIGQAYNVPSEVIGQAYNIPSEVIGHAYNFHYLEAIVPFPIIFSTLCESTDKTRLFIVSFSRVLVYLILYFILDDIFDLNKYYVKYVLLFIIFINSVYVISIIPKKVLKPNTGNDNDI
jgi:hypothetical protein